MYKRQVLQPLHKVTGKDQYQKFTYTVFVPMRIAAEKARTDINLSVLLTKLEERLEEIRQEEKYKLEMERGVQKSTHSRLKNDSTKYAQKLYTFLNTLTAEGHPDPWMESARRAMAACGEDPPKKGPGKHTWDTSTTGQPGLSTLPAVAVACHPVNSDWGAHILEHKVMAASGRLGSGLTWRRSEVSPWTNLASSS